MCFVRGLLRVRSATGAWQRRRSSSDEADGFTLVEVLVVIVILGVLAAIVVFGIQTLAANSADSACSTDLSSVQTAVLAYKAQMGNYPAGPGTGSRQTDIDATTTDAVSAVSGPGSELLTGSEVGSTGLDRNGTLTPNLSLNPDTGAWIKDIPSSANHYFIWVSNDGSGVLYVGSGTLTSSSTQPTATTCRGIG